MCFGLLYPLDQFISSLAFLLQEAYTIVSCCGVPNRQEIFLVVVGVIAEATANVGLRINSRGCVYVFSDGTPFLVTAFDRQHVGQNVVFGCLIVL